MIAKALPTPSMPSCDFDRLTARRSCLGASESGHAQRGAPCPLASLRTSASLFLGAGMRRKRSPAFPSPPPTTHIFKSKGAGEPPTQAAMLPLGMPSSLLRQLSDCLQR